MTDNEPQACPCESDDGLGEALASAFGTPFHVEGCSHAPKTPEQPNGQQASSAMALNDMDGITSTILNRLQP